MLRRTRFRRHSFSMADRLLALLASLMEVNAGEMRDDSTSDDIEKWDSMRELMLASMLESEFGIVLRVDELENLHSVREIRSVLARHGISSP